MASTNNSAIKAALVIGVFILIAAIIIGCKFYYGWRYIRGRDHDP